jgi:endogenous inhibitor of DNA gyrase (YacG/DUF329 family)
MNIELRQNHKSVAGGYPCLWCAKVMEKVWIASGQRKQQFCSSSCKNKGKDLRRYLDAERRIKALQAQLQTAWGAKWKETQAEIVRRKCANRAGGKYYPREDRQGPVLSNSDSGGITLNSTI